MNSVTLIKLLGRAVAVGLVLEEVTIKDIDQPKLSFTSDAAELVRAAFPMAKPIAHPRKSARLRWLVQL
jgi:hypothetical protein